jgi:hypothetical protein
MLLLNVTANKSEPFFTQQPNIFMNRILVLIIASQFVFLLPGVSQEKDYAFIPEHKQEVKSAGTIFYYGVDFSHVRISDGPKTIKNAEYSKVYPPAWISYVEKEMPPAYVQRIMKKAILIYKQEEIYPVSIQVFPDFIISADYSFPVDTLKVAVKKYTLGEQSGVGLVLIPENFNKAKEKAMTWVVFFDIQTRELLWTTKVDGRCEHMGYTAHWASGVIDGFKRFIRNDYR